MSRSVIVGYGCLEVCIIQIHYLTGHERRQNRPRDHHPICVIGILRFDDHPFEIARLRELLGKRFEILPASGPDEQFILFAGRFVYDGEESEFGVESHIYSIFVMNSLYRF